jgi:hypothetical protein
LGDFLRHAVQLAKQFLMADVLGARLLPEKCERSTGLEDTLFDLGE